MLNKRINNNGFYKIMNDNDSERCSLRVGNTSYNFSKKTITKADKALEFFRKNKKVIYRGIITLAAISLMPAVFKACNWIIPELINLLANTKVSGGIISANSMDVVLKEFNTMFLTFAQIFVVMFATLKMTLSCFAKPNNDRQY
jgi:hypothetical protein